MGLLDEDHAKKGYESALIVMTANLLKKVAEKASEPATLHVIFNADQEHEFNVYKYAGFKM
ncbi:MAG: hypothetical protein ACTHJ4_08435 [Candidatus Nucleicultricaceae bacterium]